MIRPVLLAVLALAIALPAVPVSAEDDLVRQLVNACVGCHFPKDLRGRDLHGLRFVGADLNGVDLSRANLNGASFTGSDLEDAKFDDADLRNARFTGVRFRNTSMLRAKVDGIRMEGVRLDGRSILGADFHTFLRGCTGCDLREMDLSRAERRLRDLSLGGPMIPRDARRRLRELELHGLREHPPARPRHVQRPLRDSERCAAIAPVPPIPPLPAVPPMPPPAPATPESW